jgi:hypothetical protein
MPLICREKPYFDGEEPVKSFDVANIVLRQK